MATKTRQVSFAVSKEDSKLIKQIVARATIHAVRHDVPYDKLGAEMDFTAVHANGCPLRLAELLAADDFNFVHDVFGIHRHIDRDTGDLKNFFSPRFSA